MEKKDFEKKGGEDKGCGFPIKKEKGENLELWGRVGEGNYISIPHKKNRGIPPKKINRKHSSRIPDKMDFEKIRGGGKGCRFHIVGGKGGQKLKSVPYSAILQEQSCMMKRESFRYPFSLKENMENRVFRREYHV